MNNLERIRKMAQVDSDRQGKPFAILNLNPYSPLRRTYRSTIMIYRSPGPRCASGTWCNGGDYADGHADGSVGKAMRRRQRKALRAFPGKVRKKRTDDEWRTMYIEAMKEKRR